MNTNHISWTPRIVLNDLLTRWKLILAAIILGGAAGLVTSLLREPMYNASTLLEVGFDLAIERESAFVLRLRARDRIAGLIFSDGVVMHVIDQLPQTIKTDRNWRLPTNMRQAMKLDPNASGWNLFVTDRDPEVAALVANIWADVATRALAEAGQNAALASELLGGKFELACTQIPEFDPTRVNLGRCKLWLPSMGRPSFDESLREAVNKSRGIPPAISFSVAAEASAQASLELAGSVQLVLAGAISSVTIVMILLATKGLRERNND